MLDACRARLSRNQTNRKWPLIKVPDFFPGPSDDQRCRLNLMLLERLTQPADKFHFELIYEHLARRQAKVAHFGHRSIRILADANDQTQAQRLFSFVGGYARRALSGAAEGLR